MKKVESLPAKNYYNIGDLVWTDIKFDVALNTNTQKAKKFVYTVEKNSTAKIKKDNFGNEIVFSRTRQ